jgi:hypothetical protein
MDQQRVPFVPVDPPRPVTVDLTPYGPRRLRWGVDTPVWARAAGWRPERDTPALVTGNVLSAFGDWWALVEVPLVDESGHQLAVARLVVPPEWVTEKS